jgi:uncharacterized protein (TIRG00374 family)
MVFLCTLSWVLILENKPTASQKYKPLLNIARILGSGFLLIWATMGLDWSNFGRVLTEINLWFLLLAPFVYAVNVIFSILRWQVILKQWDIKPGTWKLSKIYLISAFWGNFLPSTVGGDGYRFLALHSHPNASKTKIFSSLLLDRVFGLIALVIAHFIIVSIYWRDLQRVPLLFNVELAIFIVAIILGILWLIAVRFFNFKKDALPETGWLLRFVNKVSEIITLLKHQPWTVSAWCLFFSLLCVISVAGAWQIYYRVADAQVSWGVAFYAATLIGILGILPITLNGIGILELCQVTILSWQGLPVEKAILAAFLTRIMLVILTLPGGLLYLLDGFKASRDAID